MLLSFSACSNNNSFVVVEESEFGDWQGDVDEVSRMLNAMDLSVTDADDIAAVFDDIKAIREKMTRLNKRVHRNFLHSDEIGSKGLPTRYVD